jgi:transglutaminase-like putative cysteine protease
MRYHVQHKTEYQYDRNVTLSQQLLHMAPRNFAMQHSLSHTLEVTPSPNEFFSNTDYFGNTQHYFTLLTPHDVLVVDSQAEVSLLARPDYGILQQSPAWQDVQQQLNQRLLPNLEAACYLYSSPNVLCNTQIADYARPCFALGKPLLQAAFDLTQCIYQDFEFDPKATNIATPLMQVLEGRRGVCQDFAHLMIACLRSLGLACRYVSGYILTTPPAGGERLIGADASHAWVSVYCPVWGWVDFDPTNNCMVQSEHITVAWGRDFSDVSPMRGVVLGGGGQALEVSVTVTLMPQQLHMPWAEDVARVL